MFAAYADKADETRLPAREASMTLTSDEVVEFAYKGGRSAIILSIFLFLSIKIHFSCINKNVLLHL